MHPLLRRVCHRYKKKDLLLIAATVSIIIYTIFSGGWNSRQSSVKTQTLVDDVDVKNIGKLEGNNKLPKQPSKVIFHLSSVGITDLKLLYPLTSNTST